MQLIREKAEKRLIPYLTFLTVKLNINRTIQAAINSEISILRINYILELVNYA
jgi:hypothetical protein